MKQTDIIMRKSTGEHEASYEEVTANGERKSEYLQMRLLATQLHNLQSFDRMMFLTLYYIYWLEHMRGRSN